MSSETLSRATLLCKPDEGYPTNLQVRAMELPGSKALVGDIALQGAIEIELEWPDDMIDKLAGFYDRLYVHKPEDLWRQEEWNCHSFGAEVTGNAGRAQYDKYMNLTNAQPQGFTLKAPKNGELLGTFMRSGNIEHTLVTTQKHGHYMNVQGFQAANGLYYSDRAGLKKHYSGKLRRYSYEEL